MSPIGLRLRELQSRAEGRPARTPRRRGDGGGAGAKLLCRDAGSREADVGPAGWGSAGRVCPLLLGLPEARGSVRLVRYEAGSNRLQPLSGLASSVWSPAASWTPNWAL